MIGWAPECRADTLSLVRPLPWARAVGGMLFTPDKWGPGVFQIDAPGGMHLLVRRHGSPEMAFWLPAELAPSVGQPFGLYLHADRRHADRIRVASRLARALGNGPPLRAGRNPIAERQTVMLCLWDMISAGASLQEVGTMLLDPVPNDWRSSSQRSDLRRLADAGVRMVAGGYRSLLRPRERMSG